MTDSTIRGLSALALAAGLVLAPMAQAQPGYYPPPHSLPYPPPPGYHHSDPRACDMYARDQAYRYAPPGAGAAGGAVRGAVRGAAFGAIVGGSRGARRGAAAGAALGTIANGARAQRERDYAYSYAYDDCMRGFRR
ncbi:MAG: hypothetical protein MUC68_07020 [Burkholderiaceae bacterium]|nr:hypothetical protein [Burkholderiaceae bacterium]